MAYYFTVEKKKGEYTPIDITKSKYFMRTSNLKGAGSTLQEIDTFTMMFNNEKELRTRLFKEGLLEMKYAGKGLSIRNFRNNRYYKVMYDFLYQKDLEYIANPQKVIERIERKLLLGDFRFIEKFANTFMNFHDCLSTAPEVREFAIASSRTGIRSRHFDVYDENYDNPLTRMTKLLIYDYYQTPSGRTEYKNTVKYRNLHAVLAFTNYYDKKNSEELEEMKEVKNQTSLFEEKPKTRKKEKKNIEGQTSLFDE